MTTAAGPAAGASLSVAVCQLTSVDDFNANLQQIESLLSRLESDVPDLVCFPENSLYFRMREGQKVGGITLDNEVVLKLAAWAKKHRSVIHLGSVPLKKADGRLYNASLVLDAEGRVLDGYQKIHLFDVDVEGAKPMRESDAFAHGEAPWTFEVKGFKLGSTICYDLRFSELFLAYAKQGVDAILVPSAFLVPTGQAHWHVLIRARAIECQAYVLAAAQGGSHTGVDGGGRSTFGHSMIVDPWGVVVAECPEPFNDENRILRATLTKERVAKVRRQIPMSGHRRLRS